MNSIVASNALRFVGILLFQVLVLNHIELHGFISPFIYPLALLMLPLDTPRWLLMIIGFFTGLFVDIFASTPGLHASACVFLGYIRPIITNLNRPPGDYETSHQPNIESLGVNWFLIYAAIAVSFHHIFYFFVEVYSLAYFFSTMARIIGSVIFSVMLMMLYQYLFYGRR